MNSIHLGQQWQSPGTAGFCQHIFQLWKLLKHATHNQMAEPGLAVVSHLGHPKRFPHHGITVVWGTLSGMLIHDQVVIFDGGEYSIPCRIKQGFEPGTIRWNKWQHHTTTQTGFGDEFNIPDGFIKVVGQDQPDPGTTVRIFGTKILEPSIVRPNSCQCQLIIFRSGWSSGDDTLPEKRGHCIWKNNFANDTLTVLVIRADIQVPVAHLLAAIVCLGWVFISAPPLVKSFTVFWFKVFAILFMTATCMGVSRDKKIRIVIHCWLLLRSGRIHIHRRDMSA